MTEKKAPKTEGPRRAISTSVFDRIFEAGVERGNALDVDEPKLTRPTPGATRTSKPRS